MARIRSLKPDHKSHRKVGPLTDRQYRLWVGMLTEADDEGRLVADPGQLRHQVFGYHPAVRVAHVVEALAVLASVGLINLYCHDGTQYAQFPSWTDHQVINKPVSSKLPPPLHSLNGHVALPEDYGSTTDGREGSGVEGKGVDVEGAHARPTESMRIQFHIPEAIAAALNRAPRIGAVTRLREPAWWQAILRANRGVDYPVEVLKAEAYLVSHPERRYKDLGKFLHGWMSRADRSPT